MKRRKGIVAIVALVVVFCFAISAYADPGPKPPTQVEVINTPLDVNAAQSGPWNVGISGTPNVNVANTPLGVNAAQSGTWDVAVSNTTANPIPVEAINAELKDVKSIFVFVNTGIRFRVFTLAGNESFVITDIVVHVRDQDTIRPRLQLLAEKPVGVYNVRHEVAPNQFTDDVLIEQHFVSGILFKPGEYIVVDPTNSTSAATFVVTLSGYYIYH
jgi:hypothetical protein